VWTTLSWSTQSLLSEMMLRSLALVPEGNISSYTCLILAVVFWGSFPVVRRLGATTPGYVFSVLSVTSELLTAVVVCFVFGSLIPAQGFLFDVNNFVQSFWSEFFTTKNVFLLLGGLVSGSGDFIGLSAYQYVPAALGFPVQVGVGLTVGTLSSYFIVGCNRIWFLLTGLAMCVSAVLVLAWGQALPKRLDNSDPKASPPCTIVPTDFSMDSSVSFNESPSTSQSSPKVMSSSVVDMPAPTVAQVEEVNVGELAEIALAALSTSPDGTDVVIHIVDEVKPPYPDEVGLQRKPLSSTAWVAILATMGAVCSWWGPLSTLGRTSSDEALHMSFLVLMLGRALSQMIMQPLFWAFGFRGSEDPPLFAHAWSISFREKLAAVSTGLCLSLGYYCYFLGSHAVNKSAAFAITNCCPLWTIVLGAVMGELRDRTPMARVAVCTSALLFMGAIPLLTLS
jgi:drug/metabolite transporter (DMT)-like permease